MDSPHSYFHPKDENIDTEFRDNHLENGVIQLMYIFSMLSHAYFTALIHVTDCSLLITNPEFNDYIPESSTF